MVEENKIEKLLNKYTENYKATEQQLDDTRNKMANSDYETLDESQKEWLNNDWISCTGQLSVYECIIRDLNKILNRKEETTK